MKLYYGDTPRCKEKNVASYSVGSNDCSRNNTFGYPCIDFQAYTDNKVFRVVMTKEETQEIINALNIYVHM